MPAGRGDGGRTRRARALSRRPRIGQVCRDAGHEPPVICTPSQLTEMEHEEPYH
jgi:hypothetical protein